MFDLLRRIMQNKRTDNIYEKKDDCLRLNNRISFGIEIEFMLYDKSLINDIGQRLFDEGYTTTVELRKYDVKGDGKEWVLKKEATCDYELSSPVFYDTKDAWEQIGKICHILSEFRAYRNDKCALHIHIGADGILENGERWVSLFETYRKCEPFIIKFSGDGDIPISHTRLEKYALCINVALNKLWMRKWTLEQCLDEIKNNNNYDLRNSLFAVREIGMNWRCLSEDPKTFEFRTFNGSLNPETIQEYIFIVTRLVDCVNELRNLEVNEREVIDRRKMSKKYVDSVVKYLFPEKELQAKFNRVFRNKPELDGFIWDMLDGIGEIDVRV